MRRIFVMAILIAVLFVVTWCLRPGDQLIVNNAEKSDAMVVLAGSQADSRYWRRFGSCGTPGTDSTWWLTRSLGKPMGIR